MTIAELDDYKKNNPNMEQVLSTMNIVDPVGIGVKKPPSDFTKHVLGRIKKNNPLGGAIERRWNIPREF